MVRNRCSSKLPARGQQGETRPLWRRPPPRNARAPSAATPPPHRRRPSPGTPGTLPPPSAHPSTPAPPRPRHQPARMRTACVLVVNVSSVTGSATLGNSRCFGAKIGTPGCTERALGIRVPGGRGARVAEDPCSTSAAHARPADGAWRRAAPARRSRRTHQECLGPRPAAGWTCPAQPEASSRTTPLACVQ